jgi:MFS family permease
LIFFRSIQGITTAITIPVGVALIQNVYKQNELAKAMGIFGTITGAGLALGPVMGGALVTKFGWSSVFFVNIPFVIVGFSLCLFTVKESRSSVKMSLDYFGILFLISSIGALVFSLVEANTYGWTSPLILGGFAVFLGALILLVIAEKKAANPIIDGALFKNKVFVPSVLFSFVGGGLMAVILFINPLYLHEILNKSIWMTGVFLFIMPLTVIIFSPIIGYINHQVGPRKIMIYGSLFYIFSIAGHLVFSSDLNNFLLIFSFFMFGLGWAIANQAPAVALGQSISEDHLSVAMGALFSFYNIGAAVMLAIGVTLFHEQAFNVLLQDLSGKNIQLNDGQSALIEQFVRQPDNMQEILAQLHFSQNSAETVLKDAFMAGTHAMFWPLVFLVAIALFALIRVMSMKSDR